MGLASISGALGSFSGAAQTFAPAIKIVFPFAAGGPGDAVSRMIAESIGAALGRAAVVENRTGADGRIGIQAVKAAQPNGDTLLVTTGPTMWLMHMVHTAPGFDPYRDFAPVAQIAGYDFCVAAANNTGLKTLPELLAWIKANPQKASYGIPGAGTIPHFIGTRLAKLLGADMTRIVYRGGVLAINDLISGQIPISVGTLADALQQHRAGTIRILAVTGRDRSPFTPEVPTLTESGVDVVGDAWYGLWAPAGTPGEIVQMLNAAVTQLLQKPAMRERMALLGLVPAGGTPEQLATAMTETASRWAPIVKETGYTIEQ